MASASRLGRQIEEVVSALDALGVRIAFGLIALKLQGLVNDPRRTQDVEDIRALVRANRANLNIAEIRDYLRADLS